MFVENELLSKLKECVSSAPAHDNTHNVPPDSESSDIKEEFTNPQTDSGVSSDTLPPGKSFKTKLTQAESEGLLPQVCYFIGTSDCSVGSALSIQ